MNLPVTRRDLLQILKTLLLWQKTEDGKWSSVREKASGILVKVLDAKRIQDDLVPRLSDWQNMYPEESLQASLLAVLQSAKKAYLATHDGFRNQRNAAEEISLTVDEMWGLTKIVELAFISISPPAIKRKEIIGIGLIRKGIQDAGKNLIKAVWQSDGYQVVDFGRNIAPADLAREAAEKGLSALGVSCMTFEGAKNLPSLAEQLKSRSFRGPLILGGIAVNPRIAWELGETYGVPTYYGRDATEAIDVLNRALAGKPRPVGQTQAIKPRSLPDFLIDIGKQWGIELFDLPVRDIQLSSSACSGCSTCPPAKKNKCPLELGFEQEHSVDESREFLAGFTGAALVKAGLPDMEDIQSHRELWNILLEIEYWLEKQYNRAFGFRFPIPCPFCSEPNCTLAKGYCQNEHVYRSIPETYLIDIPGTVKSALGQDELTGMFSVILVG